MPRAAWDYIPNPPRWSPFFGGAEGGGGGLAVVACTHPCGGGGGGVAGGELRPAWPKKTRWRPLGSWAPSRKNLGFAGGGTPLYGMVWYGMVWYGMVWYGMVWYGMLLLLLL